MQIDSHMTFLQDWDALSIQMLLKAPSQKPVISHYPPPHTADLVKKSSMPAPRLCGPVFANSDLESQIIRLEGLSVSSALFILFHVRGDFLIISCIFPLIRIMIKKNWKCQDLQ